MAWSQRIRLSLALGLSGAAILVAGCNDPGTVTPGTDSGPRPVDAQMMTVRCSAADDPDMDFISSMDEGDGDADGDGTPNFRDDDSDGDGVSDVDEAGDRDCNTRPADTDRDMVPDFLDADGNGDGVPDVEQTGDQDGDGIPDGRDTDVDGDNVPNAEEYGTGTEPVDTDMDGTPDVFDTDSDGDTILDRMEGRLDPDGDMIPSYRDLDSDNDGIEDAVEAGDGDLDTPPRACPNEIDPLNPDEPPVGDGLSDFADADSDNDGAGDGEEGRAGTDPCDIDTDDDGLIDLVEVAFQLYNCPDGTSGSVCECQTATRAECSIPAEDFYVVLPYRGDPQERTLEFGTTIRVADVFFLSDTTGSMSGTITNVRNTVATAGTGLIDRISATIPDCWFGGGQHDDMPFGGYGSPPDEPFILAIRMTPPEDAALVRDAWNRVMLHGGNDGPESQTESLYRLITGEGQTWMYSGGFGGASSYTIRNYRGDCLETGWGAACFREAALPIVVHFTDICSHNGPPDEDSSCDPYVGITPPPTTWEDMISAMNRRGAKYIGVNAREWGAIRCTEVVTPMGDQPCWFLRRTAFETGSVDLEGNPLVYDLPNGTDPTVFADTIVRAVETVATRVPLDVDTQVRDDPMDEYMVDARRFVKRRQPACQPPATTDCWVAPEGVEHTDAVAFVDTSTFFGVVPGTRVTFRITFQNDFWPGGASAQLFIAFIDVRGGGSAVLDTRQVFILVPANSGALPG